MIYLKLYLFGASIYFTISTTYIALKTDNIMSDDTEDRLISNFALTLIYPVAIYKVIRIKLDNMRYFANKSNS